MNMVFKNQKNVNVVKMSSTLKCFKCGIDKPLEKYKDNNRKYQIKGNQGKCIVCKLCSLQNTLNTLSVVRYDYEENKFVVIPFQNKCEVVEFFDKEGGEF
jgi:hypothetical protein